MVLPLALKRTISFLMFSAAPAVVSVLVVILLLDMSPVAATDAADIDPDVDIEPPVTDPVEVRSTRFVMFFCCTCCHFPKCHTGAVEGDDRGSNAVT